MKRGFLVIVTALAMVVLLGATGTQAASQNTNPKKEVKTAKPAVQPQLGGTYEVLLRNHSNVFGYPPRMVGAARDYAPPFFDRLLTVGDDGKYKPGLALSWETSKDGKAITFKLRQGVKFHDGTPFNAQAVKANVDNLIPPKATLLDGITSAEVVDEHTVKLNLPEPNNLILYHFANNPVTWIYSPEALQKNGADWATTHPVGTGPFMLKEYVPNISVALIKNPHYWQKGLPYLDGIKMSTVTDPMTQMMMLKAGQAHAIYDAQTTAAQLRDEGYPLQMAPGSLIALNFDAKHSEYFSKAKVRQAIEYAIDKESICSGPGQKLYIPAYQMVIGTSPDYNKACAPRKYDPVKAKKLLAEAGYPKGFSFKVFVLDTQWRDGWVAVQSYLDKVGIKMDINFVNVSAYNLIRTGKIERGATALHTFVSSANTLFMLDSYLRSNSPTFTYVAIPAGVDESIDKAKLSNDPAAVTKLNRQIMKLLYDDETVVPLWYTQRIAVLNKSVQNTGWFIDNDPANNEFGTRTWLKK